MKTFLLILFVLCGLVAVLLGWIVPAHLRAVDPFVLRNLPPGKTLVEFAIETASHNPPVAKVLVLASEELNLAGHENALDALREADSAQSESSVLSQLEDQRAGPARAQEVPVLVALRPPEARSRLMNALRSTEARRILENRNLTNTTLFAPVKSAAGLPLDTAILTTAFLAERRAFEQGLRDQVLRLTASARTGEIEEFYLNILALAKRFSSAQIAAFVAHVPSTAALDLLCRSIQNHPASTSLIYSAVVLSRDGAAIANYLRDYPKTSLQDLSAAIARGTEPLTYLVREREPIFRSAVYNDAVSSSFLRNLFLPLVDLATNSPKLAMLLKFFLLVLGSVSFVAAARFASRREDRHYVEYRHLSFIRRAAAAAVILMLLVIVGEPYLAQASAEEPPRPRVSFSLAALVAPAPTQPASKTMIDQHTLLAIATFLTLQSVIYAICLVKLAEIRKQPISSGMKLKLLDNEENLFDGGLYCGLFGTAASLILLTLGVIKPSLISAYSSTLFGILFVALIKIVHVRPYKRRLILDLAELQNA